MSKFNDRKIEIGSTVLVDNLEQYIDDPGIAEEMEDCLGKVAKVIGFDEHNYVHLDSIVDNCYDFDNWVWDKRWLTLIDN